MRSPRISTARSRWAAAAPVDLRRAHGHRASGRRRCVAIVSSEASTTSAVTRTSVRVVMADTPSLLEPRAEERASGVRARVFAAPHRHQPVDDDRVDAGGILVRLLVRRGVGNGLRIEDDDVAEEAFLACRGPRSSSAMRRGSSCDRPGNVSTFSSRT